MNKLPNGWVTVPLGKLLSGIVGGGTPSKSNPDYFLGSIPFMTVKDMHERFISDTQDHITEQALEFSSSNLIPEDTLIVSSRMSLGKIVRPRIPVAINQDLKALFLYEGIDKTYIEYAWRAKESKIKAMGTGTTVKGIRLEDIRGLEIALAPRAEQIRIATQLDKFFTRIQACNLRLETVPMLIKRLRQAVLDAATSGTLTEDWEPESKHVWTVVQLSDVASDFSYGSAAKSSKTGSVPVLRMGNIQDGRLDWSDLVFTSDPQEINKYKLLKGDLLFNRTNSPELVGKAAVYQGEHDAIYAGYLIRVRCLATLRPEYLNYCLGSKAGRAYCWSVKSDGVSQSNINAKKLAAFKFLLPSIQEQDEIIRRVETLQKLTDLIEASYIAARNQVQRLAPLILSKAFRGELSSQDPQEEHASVLLKRIEENRKKQVTQKKSSRTVKRKPMQNSLPRSLSEVISQMGEDYFTFEQLREVASRDYESLKDELFALLAHSESGLKQVFDTEALVMKFKSVRK